MKGKAVFCIVILILAMISMGIGCNSAKGGEAVDMMKKMPKDSTSFQFMDVDALRTDNDLEDLYIKLEYVIGMFIDIAAIDFDKVDRYAHEEMANVLLEGDFDLDKVRETFTELDYDRDEYNGIELWGLEGQSIALVSNKLIIFSFEDTVKDYIKVIKGVDDSLYDDEDFRDVMERLPRGIVITCTERKVPISYYEYDGLEVGGFSMMKKDKHIMAFTGVGKFENRDNASNAMDRIEDDLENDELEDWKNIDIKQDGEFITVTTELDIGDMFGDCLVCY